MSRAESPGLGVRDSGLHPTATAKHPRVSPHASGPCFCYVTHWEEVKMNGGQQAIESEGPWKSVRDPDCGTLQYHILEYVL